MNSIKITNIGEQGETLLMLAPDDQVVFIQDRIESVAGDGKVVFTVYGHFQRAGDPVYVKR